MIAIGEAHDEGNVEVIERGAEEEALELRERELVSEMGTSSSVKTGSLAAVKEALRMPEMAHSAGRGRPRFRRRSLCSRSAGRDALRLSCGCSVP
jgi:hypothetical protein